MKHIWFFASLVFLTSNVHPQNEEGCWHYTYEKYFKVRKGWGGYEQSGHPIVSKAFIGEAECISSANLLEAKVTSNNIYEWLKFRIVKGCSCTPSLPLKKTGWDDSKKSEMYHSALTQNTKDWYLKYIMDKINPINTENLLQVASLYPKNEFLQLVLGNMGTAVGAISFAKWYIDESNNAMEDALNKSMQLLNFPIEKRSDFLIASTALLDNYAGRSVPEFNSYLKSIPFSKENLTNASNFMDDNLIWSQKAAVKALEYLVGSGDEDSRYKRAANFALAASFVLADGDKRQGTSYLIKALKELNEIKETALTSKLRILINDINKIYNLNMSR